jgi:two-component system CheB/CheR fusion protein
VAPAGESAPGFLVVVFDSHSLSDAAIYGRQSSVEIDEPARHLERELEATKAQLRDTIEQSEASTEELKASNEELQAMNEELRSATEELETSREELQSINEELTTVNHELKGNVDQLAQANSDLQNLMSATAVATVFLDRELRIMRYTPSAVAIFNLIPSDIGRPLTDLSHRLDYVEIVVDAEKALTDLSPTQREVRAGRQWLLARTLPYRTTDDRIAGVVLTFVDITALREAENTLRESEQRFRAIVRHAAAGVANLDFGGRFTLVNPRFCDLTGYREEALIGTSIFDLMDADESKRNRYRFQSLVTDGASYEIETSFVRKDGSSIWVNISVTGIDSARSAVVIVLDLTKRKRAEAELIDAKRAAEAANLSKDHFLAVLSHELRTPLTPVLMAAAALEHDPDLRPDVREDLSMVKRNIELETKLIDDLLDLNRINSGKLELSIEAIDLNLTVRHVCGICQSQVYERGTRLETKLHEGEALIAADSARLQQVLWNVLKNAIKFTGNDGEIHVMTSRLPDGQWEIRVRDNGIGISAERLPRIFDAFEQGGATVTKQFGGLGLGLAICKAVVERHGGSIRAESPGVGHGTTLIIEMPGNVPEAALKRADPAASEEHSRRLSLLLIEDHRDTARTLSRLLRNAGFTVLVASNVAAAVAAAEREEFDVIVSDLGLPDGTGYEVMRRVRNIRGIPGIAMSGYGMEEDVRRSLNAGFTEHLVKPIDSQQLIAAINRVTENREGILPTEKSFRKT